jgi:spore maturation protein CgeB
MEAEIAQAMRRLGHHVTVRRPGLEARHLPVPRSIAMGFERLLCGLDLLRSGHSYARLRRPLLRWLSREKSDVLIIVTLPLLAPEVAAEMKARLGVHLVGWYPDAVINLAQHDFVFAPYDLLYFKDPFIVRRFAKILGSERVRYLPEAFDEEVGSADPTPAELRPYRCDVMLYGNLYPYRVRFLEALKDFSVRIYGPKPTGRRWLVSRVEHSGLDVRGRAKVLACRGAAVCLNPCHFGEIEGTNKRLWELAGIGAFQLTDAPAASTFFDPEEEVATFSTVEDLRHKLAFYLREPERRQRMARAAREKVLAQHTWVHRAQVVLEDLARLGRT